MKELNDKVESYIIENASTGKMKTINQIKAHFCDEGYDIHDIEEALRYFSIKHCSNDVSEYT